MLFHRGQNAQVSLCTAVIVVWQRREKNNVKRREEIDANAGIKNAGIPTAGCKPPVNCLPESRPGAR